jgi:Domain of unknown function (DUF222)/HNH endonuclease
MCSPPDQQTAACAPANTREALDALHASLTYLATANAADLTAAEQADCLRALAKAESVHTAATVTVLAAFTAQASYTDDGQGSARTWLRWQTRVTIGAAAGAVGWMRRLAAHPAIGAALAAGQISTSWARQIADWTDKLPYSARGDADEILLAAADAGTELADLGGLAEEMYRRTAPADIDNAKDGFTDRDLHLHSHFRGAGKLDGNLTPECTAALRAVLDALGAKAGPEDYRTPGQRHHDALEDMCRRLVASGCLPDRAGQPTQIMLHMTADQLFGLDSDGQATAEWAGYGATAGPGSDCDASIVPIVTGHVDPDLLDQLAATLLRPRHFADEGGGGHGDEPGSGARTAAMATRAARELVLGQAVRLLSGPAGLASWLRNSQLPRPAASISLPLDVGTATDTIPPHLRRAVILRDKHCAFPGCIQPPVACQVHHIIPRSEGGPTSLENLLVLCPFHHLVAVHRWGWQIRLHADGTTAAVSPGGGKTLQSHSLAVA